MSEPDAIPDPIPDPLLSFERVTEMPEIHTGCLYVNLDFLDLLHHCGSEAAAFEVLGKLKDLLG